MKNYLCIFFLIGILCTACNRQSDEKVLFVLHTNDTHSCIEPTAEGYAGFVRRATLLQQLRDTLDNDLLLLDCGDFSQGSLYYNQFRGEVEVDFMNLMGYDAATIGNHEFDFGLENMARLFQMANFPIVCANYDFTGTVLDSLVKPYSILTRKGIKVGVFGVSPALDGLVSKENYEGIGFLNPIEKANETAQYLKNEAGCDVVICLSHLGWNADKSFNDEILIAQTRNIDLVLGGHSHSYFDKPIYYKNLDGDDIPLQQMGKNGRYVGEFKLSLSAVEQ